MHMTLAAAIKQHLAMPGDSLVNELKKLTPEDRQQLKDAFTKEFGYTFEPSA